MKHEKWKRFNIYGEPNTRQQYASPYSLRPCKRRDPPRPENRHSLLKRLRSGCDGILEECTQVYGDFDWLQRHRYVARLILAGGTAYDRWRHRARQESTGDEHSPERVQKHRATRPDGKPRTN